MSRIGVVLLAISLGCASPQGRTSGVEVSGSEAILAGGRDPLVYIAVGGVT